MARHQMDKDQIEKFQKMNNFEKDDPNDQNKMVRNQTGKDQT
jgi:hypothetical protein